MLDYVYALKRNAGTSFKVNVTRFLLDATRKSFKINASLYNDFMKYDLMNALQNIVEKELYFPESYMGEKPLEFVKKIIQTYTLERENMLELIEYTYQRNLIL